MSTSSHRTAEAEGIEAVSSPTTSPSRFGGSAYKRSTNFKKADRKTRGVSGEVSPTSLSPSGSHASLPYAMSPMSGHMDTSHRSSTSSLPSEDGMALPMVPLSPERVSLDTPASMAGSQSPSAVHQTTLSPSQLREWMSPPEMETPDESRNPFRSLQSDSSNPSSATTSSAITSDATTSSATLVGTVPSFSEAYSYDTVGAPSTTSQASHASSQTETTSNTKIRPLGITHDERTVHASNVEANATETRGIPSTIPVIQTTIQPVVQTKLLATATTSDEEDEDFYTDHVLQQSRERALELQHRTTITPVPSSTTKPKAVAEPSDTVDSEESKGAPSGPPAPTSPSPASAVARITPVTPSWELPVHTSKVLFGGEMYQTMAELAPVLSIVEAKRHAWFQRELAANQTEWDSYRVWLRSTVAEVTHVQDMIRDCLVAFTDYAAALDDLAHDVYVDEHGHEISKKKSLFQRAAAAEPSGAKTTKPLLDPLTHAYGQVQAQIDTYLVSLQRNVEDATTLRHDIAAQATRLEDKGRSIGTLAVEHAEANIQVAFQALMAAAADWLSNDDVDDTNEAVLQLPHDDASWTLKDRWLLESRYRNAAKLGLLTWKDHRRDYQNLYAEIIALDQVRQTRLQEILLSFLPKRNKLLNCVHGSLVEGSEALEATKLSMKKENEAIEHAIEMSQASLNPTLPPPSANGTGTISDALEPSLDNVWDSVYVKYRRVVAVKTSKATWKSALCVVTLDHHLHVFVVSDDQDDSADRLSMDAVAARIKVLVPEYSIKLSDFDVRPEASESSVEIDLSRRARSKIFRKKDDMFVLLVQSTGNDNAMEWAQRLVALSTDATATTAMTTLIPPPLPLQPVKPPPEPRDLTEI